MAEMTLKIARQHRKDVRPATDPNADSGYTYTGKTVTIGTQTWMAENLNRETTNSKCYDNSPDSCAKYGRLFTWEDALTACPVGWHLPSDEEWTQLTDFVESSAGTKLKSSTGWKYYSNKKVGTDDFGFSALPGGNGSSGGDFGNADKDGIWWSATGTSADGAWCRYMYHSYEGVGGEGYSSKVALFSVRCVEDWVKK